MHNSINIANKFIELCKAAEDGYMTPMKLLKLTYIAHGWMLALYDLPLISEYARAWQYGPVIPELYNEIKKYGDQPVNQLIPIVDDTPFNSQENDLINEVYKKYGTKYTGLYLSNLTNVKTSPWDTTWKRDPSGNAIIPNDLIQSYYKKLAGREQ